MCQQKLKNYVATMSDSPTETAAINKQQSVQEKATNEHVNMEDVQRHIKNLLMKNVKLDDIYNYISVSLPSSAFILCFENLLIFFSRSSGQRYWNRQ